MRDSENGDEERERERRRDITVNLILAFWEENIYFNGFLRIIVE